MTIMKNCNAVNGIANISKNLIVYFVLNLDEIVKLPVVYRHYKKYKWLRNLTNGGIQNE